MKRWLSGLGRGRHAGGRGVWGPGAGARPVRLARVSAGRPRAPGRKGVPCGGAATRGEGEEPGGRSRPGSRVSWGHQLTAVWLASYQRPCRLERAGTQRPGWQGPSSMFSIMGISKHGRHGQAGPVKMGTAWLPGWRRGRWAGRDEATGHLAVSWHQPTPGEDGVGGSLNRRLSGDSSRPAGSEKVQGPPSPVTGDGRAASSRPRGGDTPRSAGRGAGAVTKEGGSAALSSAPRRLTALRVLRLPGVRVTLWKVPSPTSLEGLGPVVCTRLAAER